MSNPTAIVYTGNGSTTDFTFPFDYHDEAHVKVTLNGVATTAFSFLTSGTLRFTLAPAAGVIIRIYRETPGAALVTFSDGAVILGADLNLASKQPRFIAEEAFQKAGEGLFLDGTGAAYTANSKRISNVADPTSPQDAATKNYVDNGLSSGVNAAAASAAAAAASQSAAAASQSAAATSASGASGSASTATTKASEAAASAAAALASQNSATASASTATTKASEAATSASNAATSATDANTAKVAAQAAQTAAEAAAASAAASVVAAASTYDNFDDRFLGNKASDPTVDNDGNALVVGAMYFNTGIGKIKIWSGASWQLAYNDTVSASAIPNDSSVTGSNVAAALSNLKVAVDAKADDSATTTALASKAPTTHGHAQSDITGLSTALAGKQAAAANLDLWAAITPSSKADAASGVPTGTMLWLATNVLPTGFLKCNGAAVSRSTYATLFATLVRSATVTMTIASPGVITWNNHGLSGYDPVRFTTTGALPTGFVANTTYYVVPGSITTNTFQLAATAGGAAINTSGTQSGTHTAICAPWGVGDGSTTFNLPDLRGEFARGWDDGRGVNSPRVFGSFEADAFKSHTHQLYIYDATFAYGNNGNPTSGGSNFITAKDTTAAGDTETRPRNRALLAVIKY